VLVVALGTVVVPFDSSVNFAFPYITRAFGLQIPAIQWVVIAYTLTYAALMLVFGRVGDMLGYRRVFLTGSLWSAIAFVLCASASSYSVLLVARVLQGIGAALVLSCGPALATSLHAETGRTRILGIYTMVIGIGGALGPLIAGLLVPLIDWPAVFWFRAPLALLAFLLAWLLPVDSRPAAHERFDAAGGVLLVFAISALLLALNQLQHVGERGLVFAAAGLACVLATAGFIVREHRTERPIIDLRFFRDFDFSLLNAGHAVLSLAGFSVLLLVPFYLSRIGGLTAYAMGVLLACSPAGTALAAPLAARLVSRIAPRQLALVGAASMAVGQVIIGTADISPNIPVLAAAMGLQGIGMGLFQVAYFDIVTASIPRSDRGVAGSLVMMTRTLGTVTGATVLMLLFQNVGFSATFRSAAALPTVVLLLGLLRGWARR
jgi:MFS family permease